ncbi:uncharacterized protein LOC125838409 [Solanum verrucosum]|uniref:uncharacterized protein LOC125838409 n=1 Tax=Solanum verrucosum TaxID=315347 RepID=UPI0020D10997|nr:uncharacterized protein LOC125838409 [Solanum verrucosum]
MAITTRRGKHTSDLPMPSEVENVVEKDADAVLVTGDTKEDAEKEAELTHKIVPMPRPPPSFPLRLKQKTEEDKYRWFITMLKQLSINCHFYEVTGTKERRSRSFSLFLAPSMHFAKALCDLGANINLMPLSIYKKSGLGATKLTAIPLLMADKNVKKPIGVLQDVLVKVGSFIFFGGLCDT